MPLLWALAAVLGAGAFFIDRSTDLAQRSGVLPPESQTNTPQPTGTIGRNVDKLGNATATGVLLVAGAFAFSLVKK
jgi:hypothetical protein